MSSARWTGQDVEGSWQNGIVPLEMTFGNERQTSFGKRGGCPFLSSVSPPHLKFRGSSGGRNDALIAGGEGIPETLGVRGMQGCGVEATAFPETKEPFKVT